MFIPNLVFFTGNFGGRIGQRNRIKKVGSYGKKLPIIGLTASVVLVFVISSGSSSLPVVT